MCRKSVCLYANVQLLLSLGDKMRRSGAPSQLLGNAVKKPRFVPPGATFSCPVSESRPLTSKLGSSNALEKVNYSPHCTSSLIPKCSHHPGSFYLIVFFCFTSGQIQRSLAAPVLSKTEKEVQSQTFSAAPALSRVLTRVLNATESKENEPGARHPTEEEAGKSQRFCYFKPFEARI